MVLMNLYTGLVNRLVDTVGGTGGWAKLRE